MAKIDQVKDDARIWRRGVKNPEIEEVLKNSSSWADGLTYKIELDKPYKSLKNAIRQAFFGRKSVSVKMDDKEGRTWYVKVDPMRRKRRSKMKPPSGTD